MAWRFKPSKYKNAYPIVPPVTDRIRDLTIGSYVSQGNFITASAAFMAFNWELEGSTMGILPLETKGFARNISLIEAHSQFVTDHQFSPFDDGLLATCSSDCMIKLWRIPEKGISGKVPLTPELTLPEQEFRVETVDFHPLADCILATSMKTSIHVWDLIAASKLYTFDDHKDKVQDVAWQTSGNLLATQCKDRQLRLIDPRHKKVADETNSHQGLKDSKVAWVGDEYRIVTTGFNIERLREIMLRDIRNIKTPLKTLTLGMSVGILVPLLDPDTQMCFLCGKGDNSIRFMEFTNREPFIEQRWKYVGDLMRGACLVPKRALNVMKAEVNRLLQLCENSIVPITWQVPRKSYAEYHSDIFPDTFGMKAAMGPMNWWYLKQNIPPPKISLDPEKRPRNMLVFQSIPIPKRK